MLVGGPGSAYECWPHSDQPFFGCEVRVGCHVLQDPPLRAEIGRRQVAVEVDSFQGFERVRARLRDLRPARVAVLSTSG